MCPNSPRSTGVIHVVSGSREQSGHFVQRLQDLLQPLRLHESGGSLQNIRGMRRIVITVLRLVIHLDHGQPVLHGLLVAAQPGWHVEHIHDRHPQEQKRPGNEIDVSEKIERLGFAREKESPWGCR